MKQDKRAEIHELFKGALDKSQNELHKKARRAKLSTLAYWLLVAALIGTTLPHPTINIITSFLVVFFAIALAFLSARMLIGKLVMACLLLSLVSGCSATFTPDNLRLLDLNLCGEQKACRMGSASGVAVLGLGLNNVTIEEAQKNGFISTMRGIDSVRSYGLISMARIRVVGE